MLNISPAFAGLLIGKGGTNKMAKDDYHVIVYQILSYLYAQLKAGNKVDPERISRENDYFLINGSYWEYIIINLLEQDLVKGIAARQVKDITGNIRVTISGLENCQITPAGIEYLADNAFISKAKEFFKDVKSIVPFI
jgi:hypothetical protein